MSTVVAVPTDILGFFGGNALGVSQAWIVIPIAIIAALAAWSAIDRSDRGRPQHLLLLMVIAIVPLALAGFGKPRSFLYLAPIVALLIVEFVDRRIRHGRAAPALAMISLLLATSVSAIANIYGGTHPFKRNSSIPYQSTLDFIDSNQQGTALIVTTDPVLPAVMRNPAGNRGVGLFMAAARCLNSGQRYDTVFIISGHSGRSANKTAMERFNRLVADATAGCTKIATFGAGLDEDAALKSRLTGVPLEKYT